MNQQAVNAQIWNEECTEGFPVGRFNKFVQMLKQIIAFFGYNVEYFLKKMKMKTIISVVLHVHPKYPKITLNDDNETKSHI